MVQRESLVACGPGGEMLHDLADVRTVAELHPQNEQRAQPPPIERRARVGLAARRDIAVAGDTGTARAKR